jgi:hypothetical protein
MKPKLSAYVSDSVAQRLELAAKRPGANKSAIVDAALDRFLNPERDTSGDAALIRRLDRMSRQLERADRDVSVLAETIALFIRYYLTITPPLPSQDQDAARALGGSMSRPSSVSLPSSLSCCRATPVRLAIPEASYDYISCGG